MRCQIGIFHTAVERRWTACNQKDPDVDLIPLAAVWDVRGNNPPHAVVIASRWEMNSVVYWGSLRPHLSGETEFASGSTEYLFRCICLIVALWETCQTAVR
jgi:hypothetical protein